MTSSIERWGGDDDLARQRRKRDARLLDQHIVDSPLTLADVVADVLAARDAASGVLDVGGYLAGEGHHWRTIESVVGYLHRNYLPDAPPPSQLPLQ